MDNKLAHELLAFAEEVQWRDKEMRGALIAAYARIRVARIMTCPNRKADDA